MWRANPNATSVLPTVVGPRITIGRSGEMLFTGTLVLLLIDKQGELLLAVAAQQICGGKVMVRLAGIFILFSRVRSDMVGINAVISSGHPLRSAPVLSWGFACVGARLCNGVFRAELADKRIYRKVPGASLIP